MKTVSINELKSRMLNTSEALEAYERADQELEIIELLYALREHANINKSDLAKRVGVSPAAITRLEKNPLGASLKTLQKYADACGAKISITFQNAH